MANFSTFQPFAVYNNKHHHRHEAKQMVGKIWEPAVCVRHRRGQKGKEYAGDGDKVYDIY